MTPKSPHVDDLIEKNARTDAWYAIAYALLKIARAQEAAAGHLKYLGNGDAATHMGAIEAGILARSE